MLAPTRRYLKVKNCISYVKKYIIFVSTIFVFLVFATVFLVLLIFTYAQKSNEGNHTNIIR